MTGVCTIANSEYSDEIFFGIREGRTRRREVIEACLSIWHHERHIAARDGEKIIFRLSFFRLPRKKQERDPFTDLRRLLHFKVQT